MDVKEIGEGVAALPVLVISRLISMSSYELAIGYLLKEVIYFPVQISTLANHITGGSEH